MRWSELCRPGLWNHLAASDLGALWSPAVTPGVLEHRGPRENWGRLRPGPPCARSGTPWAGACCRRV
ncbi:hypothetical protein NDU88_005802 [Pleurodeles waltl]|uniref:Uncharacterized protein n=1 Tax=Pleurodeles waltl TaxID=8319 RepID=A0AAV7WY46_PLEWA|nr:hypothetical protein NDU88_005802 [Pleurodeles waltl]